jgi:hypothetical protein
MLRNLLLILSTSFLLSCAHGPKITVDTSDPVDNGFNAYNENTKKSSFLLYSASAGLIAYSEPDAQSLLSACAQKQPKPPVVRCVSHPEVGGFICDNLVTVSYPDSENYIGFNATDEKTLFSYCKFE